MKGKLGECMVATEEGTMRNVLPTWLSLYKYCSRVNILWFNGLNKLNWLNSQHDGRIHRSNGCPHSSYKERHHIILLLRVIKIALILQWANDSWERWWGQAVVSRRRDLQEFTNEDMKMLKHNWSIKTCPRAWICRSAFFKKMPQYMYLVEIIIIGIWKMVVPGYKFKGDFIMAVKGPVHFANWPNFPLEILWRIGIKKER